jgi:hypothetical protein
MLFSNAEMPLQFFRDRILVTGCGVRATVPEFSKNLLPEPIISGRPRGLKGRVYSCADMP